MIQLLRSTKEIPKKFSIDLYHIVWYNKSVGIVIKTVNGRKYAYHAYRAGKKVAQRYLGALADAKVSALVDVFRCSRVMPSTHYGLFWDVDPGRININRNANYIIERVLELGKLEAAEHSASSTLRWPTHSRCSGSGSASSSTRPRISRFPRPAA